MTVMTPAPSAPVALAELHPLTLGKTAYLFRTPDVYDPARARRLLTRQRVRRPSPYEFRIAATAGVEAMAAAANQAEEGARQVALLERWYELSAPTDPDQIDEPDFERRAQIVREREEARKAEMVPLYPAIAAIEANLERHWPPYAELLADREYWDDVSRIDMVRLLLVARDGQDLPRDDDGLVTQAAYAAIARDHRVPLATFAFGLLAPDEAQRKN